MSVPVETSKRWVELVRKDLAGDRIVVDDLTRLDVRELRAMALGMARDAKERKEVFDVGQLSMYLSSPQNVYSIEHAKEVVYRDLIRRWRTPVSEKV